MNNQYYIKNIFFGIFLGGFSFYQFWISGVENEIIWLLFIVISTVLYPFSKYLVEEIALKYTNKDFWNRGFFMDTPARLGLLAIYQVFCFIFAILFGSVCILTKLRAINKRNR